MIASAGVRRDPHSCPPIGHAAGTVIFVDGAAASSAQNVKRVVIQGVTAYARVLR